MRKWLLKYDGLVAIAMVLVVVLIFSFIPAPQEVPGLRGRQGEPGIQGVQGIQGDTGEMGNRGLRGMKGATGLKGIQGDTGATGLWGFRGPQGEQGDTGATGEQGVIGYSGEMGPQGIKGDTWYDDLPKLYREASPAVVWIGAQHGDDYPDEDPYGYGLKWQGSGFLVSEDGLIATAGHVTEDTQVFEVMFQDGTKAIADFVYAEDMKNSDVGFIRLRKEYHKDRPYLEIDTEVESGESIVILGHPWGLNKGIAITQGIIALSNRSELFFGTKLLLHTDVASYPGNSGSAVIDMDGEVVGILIGGKYGADNFSICTTGKILELALAKCMAFEAMERAE